MYRIDRLIVPLLHKDPSRPKHCDSEVRQLVTPSEGTLIVHCDIDRLHVYNLLTNCEVAEHKLPDTVKSVNISVVDRNTLLLIGTKVSFDYFQQRKMRRAVALVLSSHDDFRTLEIREKRLMTFTNANDAMIVTNAVVIDQDQDLLISIADQDNDLMCLYSVPLAHIVKSARDDIMETDEDISLSFRGSYPDGRDIFYIKGSRVASFRDLPMPNIIDIIDLDSETSYEVRISTAIIELDDEDLHLLSYCRMPDTWTSGVPAVMGFVNCRMAKVQVNLENGTVSILTSYALHHQCPGDDTDWEETGESDVAIFEEDEIPAFTSTECYAALDAVFNGLDCSICWKDENHLIVRLYKDRVPSLSRLSQDAVRKLLSEVKRREITVSHDPKNVAELVTAILE